ncbi:MAG: hypothetical protein WDA08_07745 [Weeksellaceae bacterium]
MGTVPNNQSSQEIDLSFISKNTARLFENIGLSFFRFLQFLLKNKFWLLGLIVVGAVLGYFLDQSRSNKFKHEIIVVPNFSSNTYLYNKIAEMRFKDSPISSVEIEPVMDIYQFITERWSNLEIAKYLSENNIQFNKYKPNSEIEKFYRYHLMTVYTQGPDNGGKIIDSLMDVFNSDPYFLDRQKVEVQNNKNKIAQLKNSIEYTNQILDKIGSSEAKGSEITLETYSELNELINSKNSLIDQLRNAEIDQLEQKKVIFDSSRLLNIKDKGIPFAILIPVALILLFVFTTAFVRFYQRQSRKLSEQAS